MPSKKEVLAVHPGAFATKHYPRPFTDPDLFEWVVYNVHGRVFARGKTARAAWLEAYKAIF